MIDRNHAVVSINHDPLYVEARADVQKVGRRVIFANCFLSVGDTRIVRASAVFSRVDAEDNGGG